MLDFILKITMLAIAGVAAFFSIYGLANIFSAAFLSVIIMGTVLEVGKLVTVSILYQYWREFHFLLKTYLIVAVIILMGITSLGIFGYLSAAYQEDSISLTQIEQQTQLYSDDLEYKKQQLEKIQKEIERTPASYVTKRMELQDRYQPQIDKLESEISSLTENISNLKIKQIHTQAHIGPIIYIAKAFDKTPDDAILYIVILIMIVFDPLAIGLTIGANVVSVRKRKLNESQPEDQSNATRDTISTENKPSSVKDMSVESMRLYKNKLMSYNRSLTSSEKLDLHTINNILATVDDV